MGLQNIFDMAKADRYTAEGREELAKAREADVEDRTYNIGEISQKTGLQKTANGWVKPKSGGASPERNHGTVHVEHRRGQINTGGHGSVGVEKMKEAAEKGLKGEELKKFMLGEGTTKSGSSKEASDVSLASKDVKEVVEKIKPADGAEKTELSKITQFMDEEKSSLKNAIEARESFYKNTKNPTSEQEAGLAALLRIKNKIGKQPDTGLSGEKKTISYREMGEGPLYAKKEASDSAPRVLTGDCKVRVKK